MEAVRARKERKYLERCRAAGIGFTALAFDTLGAAHPVTVEFLGRFLADNRRDVCPDPRYTSRAWDRLVVPLQVDVARQVLARRSEPTPEVLSVLVHLSPAVAVPCLAPVPRPFGPLLPVSDVLSSSLLDITAVSGTSVGSTTGVASVVSVVSVSSSVSSSCCSAGEGVTHPAPRATPGQGARGVAGLCEVTTGVSTSSSFAPVSMVSPKTGFTKEGGPREYKNSGDRDLGRSTEFFDILPSSSSTSSSSTSSSSSSSGSQSSSGFLVGFDNDTHHPGDLSRSFPGAVLPRLGSPPFPFVTRLPPLRWSLKK